MLITYECDICLVKNVLIILQNENELKEVGLIMLPQTISDFVTCESNMTSAKNIYLYQWCPKVSSGDKDWTY